MQWYCQLKTHCVLSAFQLKLKIKPQIHLLAVEILNLGGGQLRLSGEIKLAVLSKVVVLNSHSSDVCTYSFDFFLNAIYGVNMKAL